MLLPENDTAQTIQRVRVAMTGLLAVFVLIVVASVIYRMTSRERPVAAIGAPKAEVVANMTDTAIGNEALAEPMAELGVVPATSGNSAAH